MEKYTVPQVIRLMSQTQNEELILKYENILSYLFAMPTLILGGTVNLLALILFNDYALPITVFDSFFLYLSAVLFYTILRFCKDEKLKGYLMTFLFMCIFTYSVINFYPIIGPAVWSISVVLVMIAMLHINKSMLVAIALNIFVMGVYVNLSHFDFKMNLIYYIAQSISFFIIFIIAATVHSIIRDRFKTIMGQFNEIYDSEKKMHLTLTAVGDGIITVDSNGDIEFMNPNAVTMTGYPLNQVVGKPFEHVFNSIHEKSRLNLENPFVEAFKEASDKQWSGNSILIGRQGKEWYINYTVSLIKDNKDIVIGGVIIFKDFSVENEEKKKIEFLSYHDQLTGLYNRRFFEEELQRLDTSRNLPVSIIYADVNGLKIFNDKFGHEYGDRLIKKVAEIFQTECRAEEIISRIGGDEFVILLPQTNEKQGMNMLRRLYEKIEESHVMGLKISVAIGMDTKVTESQSLNDILRKAEDKMYQMKKSYAALIGEQGIELITKANNSNSQ